MTENKSWKTRTWSIIRLLAIVLLCFGVIYPVGINTIDWYFIRDFAKKQPGLALLPQPLSTTQIADLSNGAFISHDGYTLHFPWKNILTQTPLKNAVAAGFEDGYGLIMFEPSEETDVLRLSIGEGKQATMMRDILGDQASESNYKLAAAAMQATSHDISIFHSRKSNARTSFLLVTKSSNMLGMADAIYPIAFGSWRGFQVNAVLSKRRLSRLILFDQKDRKLDLTLSSNLSGDAITQEQINAIVASIQSPDNGCISKTGCG